MKSRFVVATVLAAALAAGGALAAKTCLYHYDDEGFSFEWAGGADVDRREASEDVIFEGSHRQVKLTAVVRAGERLPEASHEFRLMSYFPGEWKQVPAACRGSGWESCSSWSYEAEGSGDEGLGMVGYGPKGTYIFVLTAPAEKFRDRRPAMRAVQDSLKLF